MYSVSNNYKEACKALTRNSRTKIVIGNVTYDGSKYIKDYPKFSHSNETMIGGFPIKSAEFSLWTKDEKIDVVDKEIKIYKGLVINNEIEWIPQGVFFANEEDVTTSDTGDNIQVKCYDNAKKLGEIVYVDNNTYPISETNYIKNVISQSGFELDTNCFVESNYIMTQKPNMKDGTTIRTILSRYAEQRGAIGLFSRENKIQIKKPTEVDFSYKFYEYKKMTCENQFGPINQAVLGVTNANNNIAYPTGEKTYPWFISDNPFLDLIKQERVQEIYNQVKDLKLVPFKIEGALDSFLLDINDVITVQKKDGTFCKVTILEVETENRLKCKLSASVQNKTDINYDIAGSVKDEIRDLKLDVDYNKNKITALTSETTENTSKITSLEMDLNGVKTSVEETNTQIANLSELKGTVEGTNELIIEDALESNAIEYKVKGKSEQKVTTGKQLYNVKDTYSVSNGVTKDEDGWITISYDNTSGTSNVYQNYWTKPSNKLKTNTNYSIFAEVKKVSGSSNINLNFVSSNAESQFSIGANNTFGNLSNNIIYKFIVTSRSSFENCTCMLRTFATFYPGTNGSITFRISVVENTVIAPDNFVYEPYTGGIPSPNPDYPQEIKSIEGIENYFDGKLTSGGYDNSTGNPGANSSVVRNVNPVKVIPNEKYIFSNNGLGIAMNVLEYDKNLNFLKFTGNISANTHFKVSDETHYINFYRGNSSVDKIQLNSGEKILPYVPYGKYLLIYNNSENLFDVNDFRSATTGITKIDDDYITVTYDNTSGTSTKWFSYNTNKSNLLKVNTNYSIFLEIKEVTGNGSVAVTSTNNDSIKGQFVYHRALAFSNLSNNTTYKFDNITRANFDDCYTMLRSFVQFNVGQSGSITFRISVVEDTDLTVEDFVYKPYDKKEILIPLKKENLFDKDNVSLGKELTGTNGTTFDSPSYFTSDYIDVRGKKSIYLDKSSVGNSNCFYDINKNYISTISKVNGIIAIPTNAYYMRFNSLLTALDSIKIYEGTDSSDYWSLDSLDDVRDELEVVNNRIILHKKNDKITLNGTETINRLSSAYSTFRFSVKTNLDNILKIAGVSDTNPIMSNKFKAGNRSSTYAQIESICYGSGTSEYGDFNIYCDETKNMTAAEFKTWLSNNNLEVLYQLIEPYDVDLGTVPIALRQGYNKLTLVEDLETNTEVTYLRDNVLNEEFARQLDLDITNDNLNSTKNDISSLNTDVHNNYQDILSKLNNKADSDLITQITNRVEETVTSTEWAVNRIQDITTNGVTQVKTGNGMTFNDDGLNFDREGAPVGSSVDEAGMKITDKTGSSNSILQYTGFVTDEIANEVPELSKSKGSVVNYAKEYFFSEKIRGKYGQLEEVEDDELGKGWGIFVGGEE